MRIGSFTKDEARASGVGEAKRHPHTPDYEVLN